MVALNGIRHIAIVTEDAVRLVGFYNNVFGAQEVKRIALSSPEFATGVGVMGGKAKTIHVSFPGVAISLEITQYEKRITGSRAANDADTPGLRHIAFGVEDLDMALCDLRSHGVQTVSENPVEMKEPQEVRGTRFLYCKDPDGNIIELIEERRKAPFVDL